MQLRPHQEQAVKAMLRNTKGQIIVPTGGGKTMCMIDDAMNEFSRSYCGCCSSYSIGKSIISRVS